MILNIFLWTFLKMLNVIYIPIYITRLFNKSHHCGPVENKLLLIPAKELAKQIREQKITCESVIRAYIDRIEQVNPLINAVFEDRFLDAIKDAKKVDNFIQQNKLSVNELKEKYPLLGVPITIKGSIGVANMNHSCGVFKRIDVKSQEDSITVKYVKDAGAIPLLISNMPELCLNWETKNKIIGTTNNPYDTTKTCGGSSGGEASLMGAGASLIGLGSDIAGSVRLPAHFCGIWGHKPTSGIVSAIGHYPACKNTDIWTEVFVIGPLSRYAGDLRFLLEIIVEPDKKDLLNFNKMVNLENINVFYIESINNLLINNIDKDISKAILMVKNYLHDICKNQCIKANIHLLNYSTEFSFLRLLLIDDIENLFPGKGEGSYSELFKFLMGLSKSELNSILYGVLRRNVGCIPKTFIKKSFEKLNELKNELITLLSDDGILILPVYPHKAFPHGDVYKNIFCPGYISIFNILGFPATCCPITLGCDGLPVGIQVVAAPYCDRLTLAIAEDLEKKFGGWKQRTL